MKPLHVAAYIEELQGELSKPSVKQHLAALRMLFDWLVVGHVLEVNPAHAVRGPRSEKGMGLFVNVFYANHGKLPVNRMAHRCVLQYSEAPLSQAQEDALMAKANALDFPEDLTDAVEIAPGDYPKHYFTCPGSDEDIAAAARALDALTTKHRLYVAVVMKYQDERTPRNTVTVTEFCGWFNQTFEMWHNCGRNRVTVQTLNAVDSRHLSGFAN